LGRSSFWSELRLGQAERQMRGSAWIAPVSGWTLLGLAIAEIAPAFTLVAAGAVRLRQRLPKSRRL